MAESWCQRAGNADAKAMIGRDGIGASLLQPPRLPESSAWSARK